MESPEWGGAFIALPFLYQAFYGDDKLITRYRPQMKRYVDYLATQDSCYILRSGTGRLVRLRTGACGFCPEHTNVTGINGTLLLVEPPDG